MEMLVAITVFSTLVVTATSIFLLASRAQRKVFDMQEMQASSRYTLEAIVREIRTGYIDYGYYADRGTPLGTPDKELALTDSEDMPLRFYESDENNESYCPDEQSRPCLLVDVGAFEPAPLSPKGVKVRSVSFYVGPESDPLTFDRVAAGYSSDVQPFVTVVLSLESVGRKSGERTNLDLQTTAASRRYAR
jgi:hypothetical protein